MELLKNMGRHGIMFLQSFVVVVVVVVVSLSWPFLMCFSLWKLCDHMSGQGYTLINLNNISQTLIGKQKPQW